MSDQSMPVVEMRAAQPVGEMLVLGADGVETHDLDTAAAVRIGRRLRIDETVANCSASIAPLLLSLDTTPRDAASRRDPNRRVVRSATTGAGSPEACGNSCGKSRMPRTSAPRKA